MGGEQRVAAILFQQMTCDGIGQRQAIEGGGAASDFIYQNQTILGRVVQDVGRFRHLYHKGGTTAGEVIRRTDARKNLVNFAQHDFICRNKAAAVREQCYQRDLAHICGFAAHVGAGDKQHLARAIQFGVVGDELLHLCFHHRVTTTTDVHYGFFAECWRAEIQC